MKKNSFLYSIPLSIMLGFGISVSAQNTATMNVYVEGGTSQKGQVFLSLFTSEADFLETPVLTISKEVDVEGKALFQLHDLKMQPYAVSVFYDVNNNSELDTGFLGIPKEKVGFSNNAKGRFGPPKFKDVVFKLLETQDIFIYLGNAKD